MNLLFFIIYFFVLFYIVRKLTLLILTNYFKNKGKESIIIDSNVNYDKTLVMRGTIDKNFKIKNEMISRTINQKLCSKYNKNVYRGLDGRYKSFKK